MKDNQILLLAIDKAKKNGFVLKNHKHFVETKEGILGEIESIAAYESIIFDLDFARAFWGEEMIEISFLDLSVPIALAYNQKILVNGFKANAYRFHLIRLALAPDRLKYIEKFLYE